MFLKEMLHSCQEETASHLSHGSHNGILYLYNVFPKKFRALL